MRNTYYYEHRAPTTRAHTKYNLSNLFIHSIVIIFIIIIIVIVSNDGDSNPFLHLSNNNNDEDDIVSRKVRNAYSVYAVYLRL